MPSMSSFLFDFDVSISNIDIIMDHQHMIQRYLEKSGRTAYREAAAVHVCHWFYQNRIGSVNFSRAELRIEFAAPHPDPPILRDAVKRHKPRIMPGARILAAGIAKAGYQPEGFAHGLSAEKRGSAYRTRRLFFFYF